MLRAAPTRLRPITMTTVIAVLGLLLVVAGAAVLGAALLAALSLRQLTRAAALEQPAVAPR